MIRYFLYILIFVYSLSMAGIAQDGVIISVDELSELRRDRGLAGIPIQIDVYMSRSDGNYETIHDFYAKDNEQEPVTKREVLQKCNHQALSALLRDYEDPALTLTVAARIAGEQKFVSKTIILTQLQVQHYGVFNED